MRFVGGASAFLCALILGTGAAVAAPNAPGEYLVRPAPGSSTAAGGGYYLLHGEPGDEITQTLDLRNDSTEAMTLQLDAVDALTGPMGGASYGLATDEATRTGTWITLEDGSVLLQPNASANVAFTVRVPQDAQSGEHLAGIAVAPVEDAERATEDGRTSGASVDIRTRRVVAVQINVPGAAEPELTIHGVRAVARPQGAYLEIDIEHVGTALTRGEGTITLPGEDFEQRFGLDTFVPRTSIAYPVPWTADAQEGSYPASVEIHYDGLTATWDGDVAVGDDVMDELADRQVESTAAEEEPAFSGLWPWTLVLLTAIASGATAFVLGRRGSRRAR